MAKFQERSNFRFVDDKVLWFFGLDVPLHDEQMEKFYNQFEYEIANRETPDWYQYLIGFEYDQYGSIRLQFEPELWEYDTDLLNECNEDLFGIFCGLDMTMDINNFHSIEQDLEYHIAELGIEQSIREYIDAVLDADYSIDQYDLENMYNYDDDPAISKLIEQELMIRFIAGKKAYMKEVAA